MASALLQGFRNIANAVSGLWAGAAMYPAMGTEREHSRPRHPDMARDFASLLPQARFKQAVSDCRWLAVASDIVSSSLQIRADYLSASQWATHYSGANRAWGEKAETYCQQLDALCCTRGERYDWKRLWRLTVPHLATDGGLFLNLTETETRWPLVQPLEAPRIGSRDDKPTVQPKSARSYQRSEGGKLTRIYTPYAGLQILSGIIYDEGGREVAYRVLGADEDGAEDVDVSAQDMIHLAAPRWFSEGRPLPEMAPSLLALQDIHLARSAQLTKHINSARQIAVVKNETGTPAQRHLGDPLATRTPSGAATRIVEEGNTTFIKHKDEITPWDSKTPGGEWMAFDDKEVATALASFGCRSEMLDPSGLKGANTRAFADQFNTGMFEAFDLRVPAILRVRRWQIAKGIQRGDLEPDATWWQWGVTPPPEFSPDPGRAISSELEAVRSGAQSMPHLHRRWAQRPREVLREQANYEADKIEVAAEVSAIRGVTILPGQLGTLSQPGDAPAAGAKPATQP